MAMPTIPAVFGGTVLPVPRSFDKYDIVREIGSGGFSVVYLVRQRATFQEFACKVVSRQFLQESNNFHRFEQEARLLEQLRHPNIIQLIEIAYDPTFIYLVMEYCSSGDLCEYIDTHGVLDAHSARFVLSHLVSALSYLHDRGIVHRDLKPENIFVDKSREPKLADLGLCHVVTENQLLKTPCGTAFYAAPELICEKPYDGKLTDVWSLGVVLYVMLLGCMPWASSSFPELQEEISVGEFPVPEYLGAECENLLRSMLSVDPAKRPTMKQIAEHPWIVNFTPATKSTRKIGASVSISSNMSLKNSGGAGKGRISAMSSMPLPAIADLAAGGGNRLRRELPPIPDGPGEKGAKQTGNTPIKLLIRRVPGGMTRSCKTFYEGSPLIKMVDIIAPEIKSAKPYISWLLLSFTAGTVSPVRQGAVSPGLGGCRGLRSTNRWESLPRGSGTVTFPVYRCHSNSQSQNAGHGRVLSSFDPISAAIYSWDRCPGEIFLI
jgi:serine/threonine protein kinase